MGDSERVKMCDRLGVNNRYTGYRHNLNRGNLDPIRIGYAWMDGQPNQPPNPKWTPEPKWTPPDSKSTASKCTCDIPYECKKKAEPEARPVEKDPGYGGGNKAPLTVSFGQEFCSRFKPIPNLEPKATKLNSNKTTSLNFEQEPVTIGYSCLDQQPSQPPEPKLTQTNSNKTASKCTCEIPYQCKKKAEPEVRPAEKDPGYGGGNKTPLGANFTQDPPSERSQTFKPIPNLVAEYKCDNILLPVPLPERPKSQPKCDYQATKSLCVSKCVPVPRTKSAEKVCCSTVPDLAPQYVCANGQSDADPGNYIRKPRRECYIKNGCGKKADLDSFETPRNFFVPQPPICRPGKTIFVK